MNDKHMSPKSQKSFLWLCGLFLCLPVPSFGVLFQIDQVSEPGFVSQTSASEQGASFSSVNPTLASNGYTFGYWTIDGVRQTAPDGRSLTRVSSVINAASTYKAYYFQSTADTDSDGVLDWFEYRMFGDLTRQPNDDSDGDGYSNKREGNSVKTPWFRTKWKGADRWTTFHRIRLRRHHHGLGYRKGPLGFRHRIEQFPRAEFISFHDQPSRCRQRISFRLLDCQWSPAGGSYRNCQQPSKHNVESTTEVVAHYVPAIRTMMGME